MNKSLFEVTWRELRGQLKGWWRELSDDDLDRVAGNFDKFLGLLQVKYSYTRKRAEEEFYRRMAMLREMRAKRVEEEFKQRMATMEARR